MELEQYLYIAIAIFALLAVAGFVLYFTKKSSCSPCNPGEKCKNDCSKCDPNCANCSPDCTKCSPITANAVFEAGSIATLSPDGMSLTWNDAGSTIYKRIVNKIDADPNNLDSGLVINFKGPDNTGSGPFNWINVQAQWPLKITKNDDKTKTNGGKPVYDVLQNGGVFEMKQK